MPSDDSFSYNGIDMAERFGLRMIQYDVLHAPLRPRKVTVPLRSGTVDYTTRYGEHDERTLRMQCYIESALTLEIFDSLKFTLSRKGRIILWDKPDRHFVGRSFDMQEVIDYEQLAQREFTLNFMCDPYLYANEPTVIASTEPIIALRGTERAYRGTREAPTRISITNVGTTPVGGIEVIRRTIT